MPSNVCVSTMLVDVVDDTASDDERRRRCVVATTTADDTTTRHGTRDYQRHRDTLSANTVHMFTRQNTPAVLLPPSNADQIGTQLSEVMAKNKYVKR